MTRKTSCLFLDAHMPEDVSNDAHMPEDVSNDEMITCTKCSNACFELNDQIQDCCQIGYSNRAEHNNVHCI